jgi:hypothetical protein
MEEMTRTHHVLEMTSPDLDPLCEAIMVPRIAVKSAHSTALWDALSIRLR